MKKGSQAEKDKKNSKEIDGSNSEKSEVKEAEDKSADGQKSSEQREVKYGKNSSISARIDPEGNSRE